MGVIKAGDAWKKDFLSHLDWETFSPLIQGMRAESVPVKQKTEEESFALSREDKKKIKAEQEALLARAGTNAEEIVAEAEKQAQAIKEEAYQKGFEQGVSEAEEKVLEKHKQEFSQELAKVGEIARALQSSYSDLVKKAENSLVKLALDVAKKVIKEECREKEGLVRNMIKEGLLRAGEKPVLKVRVNPEQLPYLQANRDRIESLSKANKDFEIIADESISRGGCVIGTDSGSIDLRIEKQFEEIKESLTGEGKNNGAV